MQDSQPSSKASDPILSKLIEADSELTQQEAELLARLETIQEKRKGLKTVIGMFSLGGASTSDLLQQLGETLPNSKTNGTASKISGEAPTNGTAAIAESKTEIPPAENTSQTPKKSRGKTPRKTTSAPKEPAPKRKGERVSKVTKPARRSLGWQQYIRDEFGKSSLAEAIPQVLGRKPGGVLETGEIIDAIFVVDIPKEARSTVRERVSNILSAGLKVNKWYRGKTGCYSLSKSAAEASLTS
ncbi:hypothetical protein H6F93_28995 [Leptolyngbya sp. FACHB-671]|uniref:hypothetical protein n=1 Tax=Leptolyngbya sp. FACHB-671 TaxID=2692812 RepID=UPI001682DCB7|nr:hypothetical protein [Leptolyngbya sp. FACHB-671]MBD2071507.1 hypothetical protein [Leptolyngbya sp. FACHB-671]